MMTLLATSLASSSATTTRPFALGDHGVVGYITVCIQPRPGYWKVKRVDHISTLMVRKADWDEGIGTQMMQRARGYLKQSGVQYFPVYTAVGSTEGIDFCKGHGLRPLPTHLLGEM
jgi:GNAT superfamily N-acetyltransferase